MPENDSFIGNMRLITGALPAQYGLHTAGVVDITAKTGTALAGSFFPAWSARSSPCPPTPPGWRIR